MKDTFFRSMTWLHTWVGLLVCWLLFLIFIAGTLAFFRWELNFWAKPEIHHFEQPQQRVAAQQAQITQGFAYLQQQAPKSERWNISLADERKDWLTYSYQEPREPGKRAPWQDYYVNPKTLEGVDTVRESKGGHFFYRLHFDLHYLDVKTARWLVCFASLFMLIALITGVVIHKRIFKDLFSLRTNKGVRSWLDSHNLSSVLALPFHIMITYTGLITLIFMLFPYPTMTAYEDGLRGFYADVFNFQRTEPANEPTAMVGVNTLLDQLYTKWPDADIRQVRIDHPNDRSASVRFIIDSGKAIVDRPPSITFNATTGEVVDINEVDRSVSEAIYDGMIALHAARMAQPVLRWLYVLCGLAGCIMIASGAIMWAKRLHQRNKKQRPAIGLRTVDSLNLGTFMGLPLATLAFFYANRLLPMNVSERADQEILAFFLTWAAVQAWAVFKPYSWRLLNAIIAGACIGLVAINSMTTQGSLLHFIDSKQWTLLGFDLVCLFAATCFAYAAYRGNRKQRTWLGSLEELSV